MGGAGYALPMQNNRCLHNAQMLEPARAKVVTHLVYVLIEQGLRRQVILART
jgi:hypothetical protein